MRHEQGKHPEFGEEFRHAQKHAEHPEHQKPSVEYNLEKDPLQTGDLAPRVELRERIAGDAGAWGVRRRMAGVLALFFMLLLLGAGIVAIAYLNGFFAQLFGD